MAHLPPVSLYLGRCCSSQQRGVKGDLLPVLNPSRQGQQGLALVSPRSKHTSNCPQSSPSSRADERLRHAGHMGSNVDGLCAIIPQGISQEAHGSSRVDMTSPVAETPAGEVT